MRYGFDIDGTICTLEKDYSNARPFFKRIAKINQLFDEGNHIILFTARGTLTKKDWREITRMQLVFWQVKYHQLIFGKPAVDVMVDDIAINDKDFFKEVK